MALGYFEIAMKLPSLNDLIGANRANKYMGASFKKDIETSIGWYIKQAQTKGTLPTITEPCDVLIDFYESTRRRDTDNIQSSTKFILDALQKQKVLKGDGRKYVEQVYHRIFDSKKDHVVVWLFPLGVVSVKIEEDKNGCVY